jgi:hypothetical protein
MPSVGVAWFLPRSGETYGQEDILVLRPVSETNNHMVGAPSVAPCEFLLESFDISTSAQKSSAVPGRRQAVDHGLVRQTSYFWITEASVPFTHWRSWEKEGLAQSWHKFGTKELPIS